MMTDAKILNIFEKSLNKAIKEAGKRIAKSLEHKLKSRTSSEYYDRTNQIINSFRNPPYAKIGATGRVNFVVFDSKKIISFRGTAGKFNHHMSVDGASKYKGTPISEIVPLWIDSDNRTPNGKLIPGLDYINNALDNKPLDDFLFDKVLEEAKQEFKKVIFDLISKGGGMYGIE